MAEAGIRITFALYHNDNAPGEVTESLGQPTDQYESEFDAEANAWTPNRWEWTWLTRTEMTAVLIELDRFVVERMVEIRALIARGWSAGVRIAGTVYELFVMMVSPGKLPGIAALDLPVTFWLWPAGDEGELETE